LNELHYVEGVLIIEVNPASLQMLGHDLLLLPNGPALPVDPLEDDPHNVHLALAQSPKLESLLGKATLVGLGPSHRGSEAQNYSFTVGVLFLVELSLDIFGVELLEEVRGEVKRREGLEVVLEGAAEASS
jgi:hypothetical protein